jgi:hypothetical protein
MNLAGTNALKGRTTYGATRPRKRLEEGWICSKSDAAKQGEIGLATSHDFR